MKKYILLLLTILSFGAFAQTSSTLPSGAKPYGNQLYILPSTGDIWGGNAGYKYRVVAKKSYVDSLNVLGYKKTQVDSLLSLKQATIVATTSSDYYRGDKTFATLNKTAVGLSNVDNTSDANKPVSTAQQTALNLKANLIGGNNFKGKQVISDGTSENYDDPAVIISKTIDGSAGVSSHGFVDYSYINSGRSYAAFDVQTRFIGTKDYSTRHFAGFQSNGIYTATSPISDWYSFTTAFTNSGGNIGNYYGLIIANPAGSGTFTNKFGLYVDPIDGASSNNYQLFASGQTGKSYIGGSLLINDGGLPTAKLTVKASAISTKAMVVKNVNSAEILQIFNDSQNAPQLYMRDNAGTAKFFVSTVSDGYFTGGNFGFGTASPNARIDASNIDQNITTSPMVIRARNSGATFNTTAGHITNYTGYFINSATRTTGSNNLTNVGIYATATGGQENYAAILDGITLIGTTTNNGGKLQVLSSTAGQTADVVKVINATTAGSTFNTTAGALTNYSGYFVNAATRATGSNALTNVAAYFSASGAQNNYAAIFNSGNVGFGTSTPIEKVDVTGTVRATQFKLSDLNTAPASATDKGRLGEIRVTSDYIYVCTATNTWVRSALATW